MTGRERLDPGNDRTGLGNGSAGELDRVGDERVELLGGEPEARVGGEALGMTAALLAFGVRCVVAAVAPIADAASAAASVTYHERLAQGDDAAAALAHAVSVTPGAEPLVAFGSDLTLRP